MLAGVLGAILVVSGTAVAFRTVTSLAQAAIAREPTPEEADAEPASEESVVEPASEQPISKPPSAPPVAAPPIAEPPIAEPPVAEPLVAEPPTFPPLEPAATAAAAPAPPPVVEPPPVLEAAPTRPPPAQTELQAALSATPIVMYSASWCGVCRRARQFFAANDLHYQEIDADKTPGAWDKIEQLTGDRGVPLIIVDGEQTPGGLSPPDIMRAVSRSVERRLGVRGIQIQAN